MFKRSKSAPTEAPLSYSKQCTWNTSSVVPPLILWLCDIVPCHHVAHFHSFNRAASLAHKTWFGTAALLLLALLAKETGAQTSQTEGELHSTKQLMCFLSVKACKPVLVVTQNENDEPKNGHHMSPLKGFYLTFECAARPWAAAWRTQVQVGTSRSLDRIHHVLYSVDAGTNVHIWVFTTGTVSAGQWSPAAHVLYTHCTGHLH